LALGLVISENGVIFKVKFIKDSMTIGRSNSADINLEDSFSSGVHCILYKDDGKIILEDLESTNGTFLNNQKVDKSPFYIDDLLRIGDVFIKLDESKLNKGEKELYKKPT
jgi:pSer/pThr/pTyr-binding forkhead associated (FHA) protein